jgi:UMF1 family MFS transporter
MGVKSTAEQRAWYWYDWANSAYFTTVGTVLFGPYLTSIAERDACGFASVEGHTCTADLSVAGIAVSPGSMVFYVITFATLLSALILPVVGAFADRVTSKRRLMAQFAWAGALGNASMFLVAGTDWQLGAALLVVANLCVGASVVVYDAILVEIAGPDERDRVSSRGWAFGYLGGGLLLALNLAFVTTTPFGLSTQWTVRISLLSAAIWWAGFTVVPFLRLQDRLPVGLEPVKGHVLRRSFGQLFRTLREMRAYPQSLLFLIAYLFYNDGIQTVIWSASIYGEKQLGFTTSTLITTILVVQFVAFGGALLFGRVAAAAGTKKTILGGLVGWLAVVVSAYFLPHGQVAPFLVLAVLIGVVMGGTQALSRSFFSQLIPEGKEAEYFSLYQACERGTSWLGTLVFGLVHQLTDSYRPAILALMAFFLVGGLLLARLDARRGIEAVGNRVPVVV